MHPYLGKLCANITKVQSCAYMCKCLQILQRLCIYVQMFAKYYKGCANVCKYYKIVHICAKICKYYNGCVQIFQRSCLFVSHVYRRKPFAPFCPEERSDEYLILFFLIRLKTHFSSRSRLCAKLLRI